MPQSLCQIYLHIVFSTKDRQFFFHDEALRERIHKYLTGTCSKFGAPPIRVGGVEDHVHILCHLSKTHSVSELIRELKRDSSKWIKSLDRGLRLFQWQRGYGTFSISPTHVPALKSYIDNQAEHHRRETFQDEFRRLLKKYDVAYDERFVWD